MILPSKQVTLISAAENKQIFMFDPKTTSVSHKYRDDAHILPSLAYYPPSQQLLAPQLNKTFVTVWNADAQEAQLKISLSEGMTVLQVSHDGHYLFGGSSTGNLYIWEMPGGILLKKKAIHSAQIRAVIEYKNNHLLTVSKNEAKLWALSSFFIESESTIPLKQYASILEIVSAAESRNILALLTHKSLSFLQCSLQPTQKEFSVIHKIDYEYVCALCTSKTAAFVGDAKGGIEVIELFIGDQEKTELAFKLREGTRELQISKPRKKRTLASNSKQPITCLSFVQSLGYLLAGQSSGELTIWSNYEIKKSLHLFKTPINCIRVISKPKEGKIREVSKIKPLNKYELGRENHVLDIVPHALEQAEEEHLEFEFEESSCADQQILMRMLETIKQSSGSLEEEVAQLQREKQQLIAANLAYFQMLAP